MNDRLILLTACVNPNGMAYTKLLDPTIRLNQYKESLKWYLDNTNEKILFVENTLCDFSHDFEEYIKTGRLEYLTFNGNQYDRNLGKGYGEALILRQALSNSSFIRNSNQIIKITGRLKIKNINNIIKTCKSSDTLYANTSIKNGHGRCHSVVVITPKIFLIEFFLKKTHQINDSEGYFFEHILYDTMIKWKNIGGKHSDFIQPLIIDGISGSTGKEYIKLNIFIHLKAFIKYIAHKYGIYRNHY